MTLPVSETLQLDVRNGILYLTLNRPEVRNAMSLAMVKELQQIFAAITDDASIRAVVMRGSGGHFCAGGDVKDMANARAAAADHQGDPYYELNRAFGRMLMQAEALPQVVIAVLEGAVLGGGFGLACISDVALALNDTQFGLPETGLGIIPAQIAPFVVRRIGLTQARRLALLGLRFNGAHAVEMGLVHQSAADVEVLDQLLQETLQNVRRCAPQANRATKALLMDVNNTALDALLERAARDFSAAVRGPEGIEGTLAFVQKRLPAWASHD